MKRSELIRYLHAQGCELLREGGRHSWWLTHYKINGLLFRVIMRLVIFWRIKFVKI